MIPIRYDLSNPLVQGDLLHFNSFVANFEKNLNNAIKRGYLGQKKQDNNHNDTTLYLVGNDLILFKWIVAHIWTIANLDAKYMPCFITLMQMQWGVVPGSNSHKLLHHAFVENGFENKTFPKDYIVKACGIDTCPYCNRENVGYVEIPKVENGSWVMKSAKGQLDHFYYKALYPYLAISRNNLVPSCPSCNGYPNKVTEDAIATNLVNPYLATSSDELLFRIDVSLYDYGKKIDRTKASISFNWSANPNYERNVYVFGLATLYNNHHVNEAVAVYNSFIYTQNRRYQSGIDKLTEGLVKQKNDDYQAFKESCGVVSNKKDYRTNILSKLKTDIWTQLENGE